jgi:hypothetical protein
MNRQDELKRDIQTRCYSAPKDYLKTMNLKKAIVALSFWTLLLAPFLCGVGVLVHSCICDNDSECHHELSCSTDPCQIMAVAVWSDVGRSHLETNLDHSVGLAVLAVPTDLCAGDHCIEPARELASSPPNLAVGAGILPLLC